MKKNIFLTIALSAITLSANAAEGRLLRFPATNGTDIAFAYAGDIYIVSALGGQAQRLTSHDGYEMFPRFSPDGREIAFTAQYDGNTEVYLMPASGGDPKRLTYSATNARDDIADRMGPNNVVMTWRPDGSGIIYRNRISDGFNGRLWEVAPNGGMPKELPLPEGGFCCYSPDGKLLAYNRVFREFRTWKHYRGGMADDIWIYDHESKSTRNISNNVAQDIFPMWIGDEIFYVSDRTFRANLFVYNTTTGTTEQVTDFDDFDVRFPSTDGKTIVFEKGGYIFRFDPKTRKSSKVTIYLDSDNRSARAEVKKLDKRMTAASLSPDGSRVAVTARGEVFNVPVEKGVTFNITRSSNSNDRNAAWSPDGKSIAYIGDSSGESEIYLQALDGSDPVQLTSGNDTYIRTFQWSHDSRTIYYADRKNRLVAVDVASKSKKTLVENPNGELSDFALSHNDRWITYSKTGENNYGVVYVYDIATGEENAVTDRWYDSGRPSFSADDRYLLFASSRDFNPTYGSLEWNHVYNNLEGIYIALLSKSTASPFLPKDAEVKTAKNDEASATDMPKKGKSPKDDNKSQTKPTGKATSIDFDGIGERTIKLPLPAGRYFSFFCDGSTVYYNTRQGLSAFDLEKQKTEVVAEGSHLADVTADGKKFALISKGKLYVVNAPKGKAHLSEPVSLADMETTIDYEQEWAQIYDEAWRAYRDGFYLENMHGVDWKAMKAKYAELLPYVKCRQDLSYVIGGLIGELACGHAYVGNGRDAVTAKTIPMGLLGAVLSRDDKSGFYRIDRVLQGANYSEKLRSPLTEAGMNIAEGDFIVAINGVPTSSVTNIYSLLIDKVGVLTELSISKSASNAGARKVVVRPIGDEYPLYHYNWVKENIAKVDKATNGRVGYIYIPDMGPEGLNEFSRLYYAQIDKEGLIIDDRANGGGNVSPMIIERLLRKPYRLTMYRNSKLNGTEPDALVWGPKVLLVNKYSASDGDLFPWSFKETRLGTVIGTRSWGGIIGISGSLPYVDGTDIRVPFFTNYNTNGEWIVENHGVDPDILIDNDPAREYAGDDQQLNKAIEVILEQLKDRKPLPKTPAPRTLRDLGVEPQ